MSVNVKSLRIWSHVLVDGERVRVCGVTRRKVGYLHELEALYYLRHGVELIKD